MLYYVVQIFHADRCVFWTKKPMDKLEVVQFVIAFAHRCRHLPNNMKPQPWIKHVLFSKGTSDSMLVSAKKDICLWKSKRTRSHALQETAGLLKKLWSPALSHKLGLDKFNKPLQLWKLTCFCEKWGLLQKGKDRLPTIIFQGIWIWRLGGIGVGVIPASGSLLASFKSLPLACRYEYHECHETRSIEQPEQRVGVAIGAGNWAVLIRGSSDHSVDARNPAPVDSYLVPLFIGLYTSQVMQDFLHQQFHSGWLGYAPWN